MRIEFREGAERVTCRDQFLAARVERRCTRVPVLVGNGQTKWL
jgi:hypothetical protein